MSDASLLSLVKSIKDSQSAKIQLHTTSGTQVHLDCVYKEAVAPNFFVVFPPGKIPETLDTTKHSIISINNVDGPIALTAKIIEAVNDRILELTAKETIDPTSLREFFRVDIRLPITISFESKSAEDASRNWSLSGQTIDLSGSGVMGIFPDDCRNKNRILIELSLDQPVKNVSCLGHVARVRRLRKGRWQIALHFDDISQITRDAIITNCLQEQRRQLRENIQIG